MSLKGNDRVRGGARGERVFQAKTKAPKGKELEGQQPTKPGIVWGA